MSKISKVMSIVKSRQQTKHRHQSTSLNRYTYFYIKGNLTLYKELLHGWYDVILLYFFENIIFVH